MAGSEEVPTAEQLQNLLLESPGFTEFLLGLTAVSASLLGGGTPMLCAITVERDGAPATVASSSEGAKRLDERQYAFGNGPCLTALRTRQPVLVPDLAAEGRWDGYARAVAGEGIRSVLAVPISTDSASRAALNCYSQLPDAFDGHMVAAVQEHARSISGILRLALRLHVRDHYPTHLRTALQSRAVVDAAVSLIMAQNRCSRDTAMQILQLAARTNNQRLQQIAGDLIDRSRTLPAHPAGTGHHAEGEDGPDSPGAG